VNPCWIAQPEVFPQASSNKKVPSRLPDFLAVGPPRTGTTWLYRVMQGHVGLPSVKETQFFAYNYHLGLDWYRWCFKQCSAALPVGELAPTYFDHAEARFRIVQAIPQCRIIVSLRDPVERAYSQYKVWSRAGLLKGQFDYLKQRARLAAHASYAVNLQAWQKLFGRAHVLVLLYDDLRQDPQGYLNSICNFLGIARIELEQSHGAGSPVNKSDTMPRNRWLAKMFRRLRDELIRRRLHRLARYFEDDTRLWQLVYTSRHPYPPLDAETEVRLRLLLRPEIELLELLLNRDLSAWKQATTRQMRD
jgi:hypothetical protein